MKLVLVMSLSISEESRTYSSKPRALLKYLEATAFSGVTKFSQVAPRASLLMLPISQRYLELP